MSRVRLAQNPVYVIYHEETQTAAYLVIGSFGVMLTTKCPTSQVLKMRLTTMLTSMVSVTRDHTVFLKSFPTSSLSGFG